MGPIARIERKSRPWEQVWQGDSEAVASIVAGRLEAEGIRTCIQGHTASYRAAAFALGGAWAILVPVGKAHHAREVLRENEEGQNIIEDESAAGLTVNQRRTLQALIGAAFVVALLVAGLLAAQR